MTEISNGSGLTALVNMMPFASLEATERQWNDRIGIDVTMRLPDDPRVDSDCRSAEYVRNCVPFEKVQDEVTTIVVTGANKELLHPEHPLASPLMPFSGITYIRQLRQLVDWSAENTDTAIWSCLSAQAAAAHRYDLDDEHDGRTRGDAKIFGAYRHDTATHPLMAGLEGGLVAPHSRWGDNSTKILKDCGLQILAEHPDAGCAIAVSDRAKRGKTGLDIYSFAHLEYDPDDLQREYERDRERGQAPPAGAELDWQPDADVWFANVRQHIQRPVGSLALA